MAAKGACCAQSVVCLSVGFRALLPLAVLTCPLLRPSAVIGHRVIIGRGSSRDPKNLPSSCLGYCDILGSLYLGCLRNNCILFILVFAEPSSVPSTQKTLQKIKI